VRTHADKGHQERSRAPKKKNKKSAKTQKGKKPQQKGRFGHEPRKTGLEWRARRGRSEGATKKGRKRKTNLKIRATKQKKGLCLVGQKSPGEKRERRTPGGLHEARRGRKKSNPERTKGTGTGSLSVWEETLTVGGGSVEGGKVQKGATCGHDTARGLTGRDHPKKDNKSDGSPRHGIAKNGKKLRQERGLSQKRGGLKWVTRQKKKKMGGGQRCGRKNSG